MVRKILAFILLAAVSSIVTAQKQSETPETSEQAKVSPPSGTGDVVILSDTMGVDFGPYLQHALYMIKRHWYDLMPDVARRPIMKSGQVVIQFAILKNGRVQALRYARYSGDIALDRAAYGAITASNPFAALPQEFRGQYLELRIKFLYNPGGSQGETTTSSSSTKPPSFSVPFGLHLEKLRPEPSAKQDAVEEIGEVKIFDRGDLETASSRQFLEQNLLPTIRQHWRLIMPEKARRLNETQSVIVGFTIHKDGSFSPVSVESPGDPDLDDAVVEAVRSSAPVPLAKEFYPDLQVRLIFSYGKGKQ